MFYVGYARKLFFAPVYISTALGIQVKCRQIRTDLNSLVPQKLRFISVFSFTLRIQIKLTNKFIYVFCATSDKLIFLVFIVTDI
jgi:hypothetical protein